MLVDVEAALSDSLLLMDRNEPDTLLVPAARAEGFEEFMALIEISNIYNFDTGISAVGHSRLAITGELIVAVDLINTVAAPGSAIPDDLLVTDRGAAAWWRIESTRLPGGDLADIRAVRRLRSVLRDMIQALVDHGTVPQAADFLSDPSQVARLRRCANSACSMIFIAVNPRRLRARDPDAAAGPGRDSPACYDRPVGQQHGLAAAPVAPTAPSPARTRVAPTSPDEPRLRPHRDQRHGGRQTPNSPQAALAHGHTNFTRRSGIVPGRAAAADASAAAADPGQACVAGGHAEGGEPRARPRGGGTVQPRGRPGPGTGCG